MSNKNVQKKKIYKDNIIKLKVKIVIILTILVLMLVLMLMTIFATTVASNLAFMDYKFYIMESGEQQNIAEKGDLVIVKKTKPGDVVKGDNVVFGDKKFYYCDEVVETKKVNTVYKMIIAENEGVRYRFEENEIEGKVVGKVYNLGNVILFLRTPLGITFFIIFIACVGMLLKILIVDGLISSQDKYTEKNSTEK